MKMQTILLIGLGLLASNEAPKIRQKHILTLQEGISIDQLKEMHSSGVSLIVPKHLLKKYPVGTGIKIETLEGFIASSRSILP
jgi:hypothetical protein